MAQNVKKLVTLGVDLGATKIETVLVDNTGQILIKEQHPTKPERGAKGIISDIVACVTSCFSDVNYKGKALGIGVAGQVEASTGVVRFGTNLGWRDIPLRSELENALGIPVVVTNDVRAAMWGEWIHGAGKGVNDAIVIFVGTGIGGGIVSDGRVIEGCTNTAGELGHTTIVVDGRKCHCPNYGCLEAYAGGWAISERTQEAVRANPQAGRTLIELAGDIEGITTVHVSQACTGGDPLAQRIIDETGRYLGAGVVSIVNAFNPCLLILGGGIIEGFPELIKVVEQAIRKRALEASVERLRVVKAALGVDAGGIGAAVLARSLVGDTT
jgi:glucokinase